MNKDKLAIPIAILVALPVWVCLLITSIVQIVWFYTFGLIVSTLIGEVSFKEFNKKQLALLKGHFYHWWL